MIAKNEIKISVGREAVFEFLSRMENIPKWNYYVNQVERLDRTTGNPLYRQTRKRDYQVFEILNVSSPEEIHIATVGNTPIQFSRTFILHDEGPDSSLLVDRFEVDLGWPRWTESLFKSRVERSVRDNLSKLKALMETGSVKLQDGRLMHYQPLSNA